MDEKLGNDLLLFNNNGRGQICCQGWVVSANLRISAPTFLSLLSILSYPLSRWYILWIEVSPFALSAAMTRDAEARRSVAIRGAPLSPSIPLTVAVPPSTLM